MAASRYLDPVARIMLRSASTPCLLGNFEREAWYAPRRHTTETTNRIAARSLHETRRFAARTWVLPLSRILNKKSRRRIWTIFGQLEGNRTEELSCRPRSAAIADEAIQSAFLTAR